MSTEPVTPVPSASCGATIVFGCTAIGLRTSVGPLQVRNPELNVSSGASVRANVTVNGWVSPAAPNVSSDGSTTTSKPGRSTFADQVPACVDVTSRCTVNGAVSVPSPMDARFRS